MINAIKARRKSLPSRLPFTFKTHAYSRFCRGEGRCGPSFGINMSSIFLHLSKTMVFISILLAFKETRRPIWSYSNVTFLLSVCTSFESNHFTWNCSSLAATFFCCITVHLPGWIPLECLFYYKYSLRFFYISFSRIGIFINPRLVDKKLECAVHEVWGSLVCLILF